MFGKLPNQAELAAFKKELCDARKLPVEVINALKALPKGHGMEALTVGVIALGMSETEDHVDNPDVQRRYALRLIAAAPVIVAAWHRISNGLEVIESDCSLDHAASFLHMLTGKKPDALSTQVVDVALTLHAEHSMNASTLSLIHI